MKATHCPCRGESSTKADYNTQAGWDNTWGLMSRYLKQATREQLDQT